MDDALGWGLLLLVVLLAIGWYLSYLARRLDRLHHRVDSASAALQEQLTRRADAAARAAAALPPGAGDRLALSAAAASAAPVDEAAQNLLTRCIRITFVPPGAGPDPLQDWRLGPAHAVLLDDLAAAAHRAQLARRFHNDAVAHAQRMRRKRVVRWATLAGRAAWPVMVEIDDGLPETLVTEPV